MDQTNRNSVVVASDCVGGISTLARMLGVKVPTVHQWTTGVRSVPVGRAIQIEAATHGAVRVEDLRPDIPWHVIRGAKSEAA